MRRSRRGPGNQRENLLYDDGLMKSFRLLLLAACLTSSVLNAETFTGKVVHISDGDTIRVMHNGAAERIRLWGIDCPEKRQPFGTRASQFTGDLAFGKDVKVLVRDVDRYGRTAGKAAASSRAPSALKAPGQATLRTPRLQPEAQVCPGNIS